MLKSYLTNKDGNFAIMFSVTAAILGFGVAVAVDVAAMHSAKTDLQSNLDSSALAAVVEIARNGRPDGNNDDDETIYKAVILEALESNGYDLGSAVPNVVIENGSLYVSATIDHKFQFGRLLNKSSTDVFAATKISLPGGGAPVEIALVLDNTESMNFNGKMAALKQGARDFVESIQDTNSGSKIALVPFSRYVDVGVDKRGEPWLDVPTEFDTNRTWQQATHSGGNCSLETRTRYNDGERQTYETEVCTDQVTTYEPMSRVLESRWIGCVGVRNDNLHLEDETYNTSATRIPGLLDKNPHEVTEFNVDEESWCPHTITPLTDDYDKLDTEIRGLYGTDRTYIPMGLTWGRRILSPQAPFTESDSSSRQIMILMSDGNNTGYLEDVDEHESIPYIQDLTNNEQANGVIPPGTNEDTATLCESIKAEGTELFTIAFKVNNTTTENLLKNCASSPQHYFDAETNNSLVATFQDISKGLEAEIRIVD